MNVMTLSTYVKLIDERHAKTDIRLSLDSYLYIYPLAIVEDVLVEVAEHVYPIDFVILDIKENEKRPFILGTPFLTTAKAVIKFDKGTITLRYGKNKIRFNRIPKSLCKDEKGINNDIEPIAPTMTLNKLVLEWVMRSLGWHLEEIHVTWAHLEKKLTRLRTCTKIHQEVLFSKHGDGVAGIKRRRRDLSGDDI
ncbi:reverse transcriptase domain-containing protein [Tanacetum coccineum]